MKVLLSTLNAKFIHTSLALRYLKAYGKSKGYSYDIEEYTINMPIYHILRDITAGKYDLIGFCCYIWNIDMTLHLVALIKAVRPDTIIVLGGPEVSYTADEVLLKNPEVSFIVQGEGEESFSALTKCLTEGGEWTTIPGIRGVSSDGALAGSTEVVEVKQLGSIPFPYDEEDLKRTEHKIIYYESSRGCPFSCQYCLSGNRNTVRFFPQDRVIKELQWFIDHGVQQVKFVDRTFNCAKSHHLPLMNFIKEAYTETNFHIEVEAGLLGDEEVKILTTAAPKRFQIEVGVQSTHDKTLAAIARSNDWHHIVKTIVPIIDAGRTHVHMDLIVGLPYETAKRFEQSFNDLFALAPQALQIGFLKLLKGSGLSFMNEFQFISDPKAPYEVLANHVISYEEVRYLKIFEDVFETYYNSGKYPGMFRYFQKIMKSDDNVLEEPSFLEDSKRSTTDENRPYKRSAYDCFASLTNRWQHLGNHTVALRDKEKAKFLYDHVIIWEKEGLITKNETDILRDLLRIDVLITFGGKIKSEELNLPIQEKTLLQESEVFWKNESVVQKFIPNYTFKEWRRIRQDFYEMTVANTTAEYLTISGRTLIVDVTGKVPLFARPEFINEKI